MIARIITCLMFCMCVSAADYVTIKTKDGRSLSGYYDPSTETLTTVKPKATIRIRRQDIDSLSITSLPASAPSSGDGNRLIDQLKSRRSAMEIDRDRALAAAKKDRAIAAETKDANSAKRLEIHADASELEAKSYQDIVNKLTERIADLERHEDALTSPAPPANRGEQSEIAVLRAQIDSIREKIRKDENEVGAKERELNALISAANFEFIMKGDLDSIRISTSASPTREENEKVARIVGFNRQLDNLRGVREQAKATVAARGSDRNETYLRLFRNGERSQEESFWQAYAEFKGKPAPY